MNSKKAVGRLHTQKAHMMEMEMALKHQLGVFRTALSMRGPAAIFKAFRSVWASYQPTAK